MHHLFSARNLELNIPKEINFFFNYKVWLLKKTEEEDLCARERSETKSVILCLCTHAHTHTHICVRMCVEV